MCVHKIYNLHPQRIAIIHEFISRMLTGFSTNYTNLTQVRFLTSLRLKHESNSCYTKMYIDINNYTLLTLESI